MVGDDSPFCHRFSARARPAGDGHVELSSVPKLEGYLHRVLTEGGLSDNHRPPTVAKGGRCYLCRGGGAGIDQDDQANVGGDTISQSGDVGLFPGCRRMDQHTLLYELGHHQHRDVDIAAGVVAEVDDEGVDPAVDELGQALANEIRDVVLEVGDPDEPDAGPRDVDLDRGHRQFVSLDPEDLDHALASLDSDLDHARLVTRYPADSLDEPQTIDAGAVDGGDDVPCHQPGLGCRVVLDDEDDPELARRCDSGTSRPDCIGGVEEHPNTSDYS